MVAATDTYSNDWQDFQVLLSFWLHQCIKANIHNVKIAKPCKWPVWSEPSALLGVSGYHCHISWWIKLFEALNLELLKNAQVLKLTADQIQSFHSLVKKIKSKVEKTHRCIWSCSQGVLPLSNTIIKINLIKRGVYQIRINYYACITKNWIKEKKKRLRGNMLILQPDRKQARLQIKNGKR